MTHCERQKGSLASYIDIVPDYIVRLFLLERLHVRVRDRCNCAIASCENRSFCPAVSCKTCSVALVVTCICTWCRFILPVENMLFAI